MIRLLEIQTSNLMRQPESGMGYQIVDVDYERTIQRAIVYNEELLLWDRELRSMPRGNYEALLKSATTSDAQGIRSIQVIARPQALREAVGKAYSDQRSGKPATEGEPRVTKPGETFARFTAYENDRRITVNRGLTAGTYATTAADAATIKSGSQAVDRYALPDPQPAIYRYPIGPNPNTPYRQGIVQPAFGHRGGGDEVIFDRGTDSNTVGAAAVLPP